jgi:hypothetical protein
MYGVCLAKQGLQSGQGMLSEPGRHGPGKHKRDTFQAFTAPFIKPEAVVRCVHRGFGGTVWRQLSCPVRDNYDGRLGGLTFYSFQPA